jgi:hypothetical protein
VIRYYPSPEGYLNKSGVAYPLQPEGEIRPELTSWIEGMREQCHNLGWWFEPTSLNTGRHTPESMHYRGLGVDFNCREATGSWVDFTSQANLAAKVATILGYDAWIWSNDLDTHTHLSIHP